VHPQELALLEVRVHLDLINDGTTDLAASKR
jgi:hypothetical protein